MLFDNLKIRLCSINVVCVVYGVVPVAACFIWRKCL